MVLQVDTSDVVLTGGHLRCRYCTPSVTVCETNFQDELPTSYFGVSTALGHRRIFFFGYLVAIIFPNRVDVWGGVDCGSEECSQRFCVVFVVDE